jgi:hypothetical protein
MDMLRYCRAMAAFCRQRAMFEGEDEPFWTGEAREWDELIFQYLSPRPQIRNWVSGPEHRSIAGQYLARQTASQTDQPH